MEDEAVVESLPGDRKHVLPPLNADGVVIRRSKTPSFHGVQHASDDVDAHMPPLFDATEKLTQAPSRPQSSALSAQQRLLGSPPPSAFRKSAVGIKSAKIWNSTQTKRDTPTPGPQCPVKIVSPDEDGSNTSKPRQRTSSTMSVLSGRSRNPSADGFKEVTFVQTLSAPSTAMRSLSRASLSNNNLTPPPRVVGVSIDGAAGSLDYVQEVPSEVASRWGHDEAKREATPTSDHESSRLNSSHGRKDLRLNSIADLVNKHKNKEENFVNTETKFKLSRPGSNMGNGVKTKVYRLKPLQNEESKN